MNINMKSKSGGVGLQRNFLNFILVGFVLLAPLCVSTSCTKKGGGDSNAVGGGAGAPIQKSQGNGSGIGGIIKITYNNARARCNYTTTSAVEYQIQCHALAVLPDGTEVPTGLIEDGLSLDWQNPRYVSGSEISGFKCQNKDNGVTRICDVTLAEAEGTRVAMDLNISDPTHEKRTETDTVFLSYTVTTFGVTYQALAYGDVPATQQSSSTAPVAVQNTRGVTGTLTSGVKEPTVDSLKAEHLESFKAMTNPSKDPLAFGLAGIPAFCFVGSVLYFVQGKFIYQLANGALTLFAGSTGVKNYKNYSHRSRVYLDGIRSSIACGSDGIYVNNYGFILKFSLSGEVSVMAEDTGQEFFSGPMAVGPDGAIYAVSYFGKKVKRIDQNKKVTLFAGTGQEGILKDGVSALLAPFSKIEGMAFSSDGSLYLSDSGLLRVFKINPNGIVSTVAGSGEKNYSGKTGDGTPALKEELLGPNSIAVTKAGEIIFVDGNMYTSLDIGYSKLRKVDTTGLISVLCGRNFGSGDSSATNKLINSGLVVSSVVVSPDDVIYLGEGGTSASNIRVLNPDSTVKTVVGTTYQPYNLPLGSEAQSVALASAKALVLTDDNNIILPSTGRYLPKIAANGILSRFVGDLKGGVIGAGDGGLATSALVSYVSAMTYGPDGSFYFINSGIDRIRKINREGIISTAVDLGSRAMFNLRLNSVTERGRMDALAVSASGEFYFGSEAEGIVYKMDARGNPSVFAGKGWKGSSGDGGKAVSATLQPSQIVIGPGNLVYILDSINRNIRIVDSKGNISSLITDMRNFSPRSMAMSGDQLFVVAQTSGMLGELYLLRPAGDPSAHRFIPEKYFSSDLNQNCAAGVIQGKATALALEKQLHVSLSQLCAGDVLAVAVRNHCDLGEKTMSIAFSQTFDSTLAAGASNIIRIDRPCPP